MNSPTRAIVALVLLVGFAFLGCSGSPGPVGPRIHNYESPLDQTPRDNYEAEVAALWLSGELAAPESLYIELLSAFASVRQAYGDSIIAVVDEYGYKDSVFVLETEFAPPWVPGEILVRLTDEATIRFRKGEYADWDSLNSALRLDTIRTNLFREPLNILIPVFEGRLHPDRLVELYSEIPSVDHATPNHTLRFSANVFPWLIGSGTSFLFWQGWGDCPSGCIFNRYWYFKVIEGEVVYVGTFDPRSEPKPDWWEEAETAMSAYHGSYSGPVALPSVAAGRVLD